jgi:Domain of unknown function (DUF5666)
VQYRNAEVHDSHDALRNARDGSGHTDPARPQAATQETSMTANPTDPAEGAAFSGRPDFVGTPSRRRAGLVLAGAAILIVAAAATSLAASPAPSSSSGGTAPSVAGDPSLDAGVPGLGRLGRHGFADITITAISGNDVTLKTDDGWTRTITITSSVELTKGGQTIAASELKIGDQVVFRQTKNDDGTYTVTALAVVVPTIKGTASDITSSGFKVTTRDGSVWTVTVDGSTTYGYGQGTGSLSDVKAGEPVRVAGTITADNQMTATNVRVAGDRAVGQVAAKTADTITIKKRDGSSVTIHVSADTTYRVAGVENADLGDVAVDMYVGVTGRARSDGSIDADVVAAGNGRGLGRGGFDGFRGPKGFRFGEPGGEQTDPAQPAIDLELGVPTA